IFTRLDQSLPTIGHLPTILSVTLRANAARRHQESGFPDLAPPTGSLPEACSLPLIRRLVALQVLDVTLFFLLLDPFAERLGLLLGRELGPYLRLDLLK